MGAGQDFVKKLKPLGCALVLGLFVLVTLILFTARGAAVEGYDAPYTSEYYAEHLDELKTELEENLIPKLDVAWAQLAVEGDKLAVTAEKEDIYKIRPAVIHYYDADLFVWVAREAM